MVLAQSQLAAIESYRHYGPERPPADALRGILEDITARPASPSALVSAADVCLDLAVVDASRADAWFQRAKFIFNQVASQAEIKLGFTDGKLNGTADSYLQARVRLAEFKNWEKAVKGEPLQSNYKALRSACRRIVPFMDRSDHIVPRLLEVMPLLLGARAHARGEETGWFGRLALAREDRGGNRAAYNANWDTAICLTDAADAFVEPDIKLQIKSSRAAASGKYGLAGVAVVFADRYGLDNPLAIISGCLQEAGQDLTAKEFKATDPYTPDQLDEITGNLQAKIAESDTRTVMIRSRAAYRL